MCVYVYSIQGPDLRGRLWTPWPKLSGPRIVSYSAWFRISWWAQAITLIFYHPGRSGFQTAPCRVFSGSSLDLRSRNWFIYIMYGHIHVILKDLVISEFGEEQWKMVLHASGCADLDVLDSVPYPDAAAGTVECWRFMWEVVLLLTTYSRGGRDSDSRYTLPKIAWTLTKVPWKMVLLYQPMVFQGPCQLCTDYKSTDPDWEHAGDDTKSMYDFPFHWVNPHTWGRWGSSRLDSKPWCHGQAASNPIPTSKSVVFMWTWCSCEP